MRSADRSENENTFVDFIYCRYMERSKHAGSYLLQSSVDSLCLACFFRNMGSMVALVFVKHNMIYTDKAAI